MTKPNSPRCPQCRMTEQHPDRFPFLGPVTVKTYRCADKTSHVFLGKCLQFTEIHPPECESECVHDRTDKC